MYRTNRIEIEINEFMDIKTWGGHGLHTQEIIYRIYTVLWLSKHNIRI